MIRDLPLAASLALAACSAPESSAPSAAAAPQTAGPQTDEQKTIYALGLAISSNLSCSSKCSSSEIVRYGQRRMGRLSCRVGSSSVISNSASSSCSTSKLDQPPSLLQGSMSKQKRCGVSWNRRVQLKRLSNRLSVLKPSAGCRQSRRAVNASHRKRLAPRQLDAVLLCDGVFAF